MSSATKVPETAELTGDDARETLAQVGKKRLLVDAFQRLRAADGTSHSRSLAFMISLIIVQGIVVILGLATIFGSSTLSATLADTIGSTVPGPASGPLREALQQAREVGQRNDVLPLLLGLVGVLLTATFAMGQVERGLNRIYGVERDRPTREKYTRAFLLAVASGSLSGVAFLVLGLDWRESDGFSGDSRSAWLVLRWPLGLALVAIAVGLLLRYCPNRRQPGRAWLAFGSAVGVVLWVASTAVLALCFQLASSFPKTYGPLAGVVALLLWTYVSAFAIFYGVAVAAQLEAVRASSRERAPVAAPVEPTADPAVA